jgi:hypothetical protein
VASSLPSYPALVPGTCVRPVRVNERPPGPGTRTCVRVSARRNQDDRAHMGGCATRLRERPVPASRNQWHRVLKKFLVHVGYQAALSLSLSQPRALPPITASQISDGEASPTTGLHARDGRAGRRVPPCERDGSSISGRPCPWKQASAARAAGPPRLTPFSRGGKCPVLFRGKKSQPRKRGPPFRPRPRVAFRGGGGAVAAHGGRRSPRRPIHHRARLSPAWPTNSINPHAGTPPPQARGSLQSCAAGGGRPVISSLPACFDRACQGDTRPGHGQGGSHRGRGHGHERSIARGRGVYVPCVVAPVVR